MSRSRVRLRFSHGLWVQSGADPLGSSAKPLRDAEKTSVAPHAGTARAHASRESIDLSLSIYLPIQVSQARPSAEGQQGEEDRRWQQGAAGVSRVQQGAAGGREPVGVQGLVGGRGCSHLSARSRV